ncbi:MAG: hypothetical protein AAGF15_07085 [Pseudomonadota bacterium]
MARRYTRARVAGIAFAVAVGLTNAAAAQILIHDPVELTREAVVQHETGTQRLADGQHEGARAAFAAGVEAARALAAAESETPESLRHVFVNLIGLGDTHAELGRAEDAERARSAYQSAREIAEKLVARPDGVPEWQHDLSLVHNRLGALSEAAGDITQALAHQRQSLIAARLAADADPGEDRWPRAVYLRLITIGRIKAAQDDDEGALTAFEAALETVRAEAFSKPSDPHWQRDIHIALIYIAHQRARLTNVEGALTAYEKALAVARALVARDQYLLEWERDLGEALERVALYKLELGDRAGALAAYQEGVAFTRTRLAIDGDVSRLKRDLSAWLRKVGELEAKAGAYEEARRAYRESIMILDALVADPGRPSRWHRELSSVLYAYAAITHRQNARAEALSAYRDGLAIVKVLAERDMGNAGLTYRIFLGHVRIGDVQKDIARDAKTAADRSAARKASAVAYAEGIRVIEALLNDDPSHAGWHMDLIAALVKQAEVLSGPHKIETLEAALDRLAALHAMGGGGGQRARWRAEIENRLAIAERSAAMAALH